MTHIPAARQLAADLIRDARQWRHGRITLGRALAAAMDLAADAARVGDREGVVIASAAQRLLAERYWSTPRRREVAA